MTRTDDTLLEFLEDTGLALSPRAIEHNMKTRYDESISYSSINGRLPALTDAGLVVKEYPPGGFYSITEKGRKYLDGELDAEDIENIE
ncbi:winged helix-turn-helix domain-containing protein [Natronorubrum halophilum]|uniref:winged helix-turn-helix domain-containing protein n=1 Tax=Natronorubrum halophilum TaxID=1702106 RepID=UPI001EE8B4A1|nr:winged helix-turn-helix domain-containing protein [Natronorubrum halophilum]